MSNKRLYFLVNIPGKEIDTEKALVFFFFFFAFCFCEYYR